MSKVTLAAVGDISFQGLPEKLFMERGKSDFLAGIRDEMEKADIRFGNLESVMVPADFPLERTFGYPLECRDELVEALRCVQFDILQTASNHALDCGWRGLLNTLEKVEALGIRTLGSGRNQEEARALRVIEKNGMKIGFLGYLQAGDWTLSGGGGRIAYFDLASVQEDIRRNRPLVDFLVVSIHAGLEFFPVPTRNRLDMFRKVAEAGADLILGHHPHVPQGIERWGNCLIHHSLGNAVFDLHGYQINASPNVNRSHVFTVEIEDGKIVSWHRKYYRIGLEDCSLVALSGEEERQEDCYYRELDAMLSDDRTIRDVGAAICRRKLGHLLRVMKEEKELTPDLFIRKYAYLLFSDMCREWLDNLRSLAKEEYERHAMRDFEFKYPYADLIEPVDTSEKSEN